MALEGYQGEDRDLETNRGKQLLTVGDLLEYTGSPREGGAGYGSKLVIVKPKNDPNSHIGWVRQEPNAWGTYILVYYEDENGKKISRNLIPKSADMDSSHPSLEHYPPPDREREMLAASLEDEVYEYKKAA